jgi:hypothetical protein
MLRHRSQRPNAALRSGFYAERWPRHAPRDLLERPGRGAHAWSIIDATGLAGLAVTIAAGATVVAAYAFNLAAFGVLASVHGLNALRCRRRRSMLEALGAAGVVAMAVRDRSQTNWDSVFIAITVVWALASAIDLRWPGSTYVARRSRAASGITDA